MEDNTMLTNLDGLLNVMNVGGDIEISINSALCQSLVDAFIGELQAFGWTNSFLAFGNDTSC